MKAVIFDFDGTLANTLPICFDAFQCVFNEFDRKELNSEEIKAMFGPSETGIIKENLSHLEKDEAIELFYDRYAKRHTALVERNEEIEALLHYLKSKNIKLGIVTGKAKRSLDISLKYLQMEEIFDVVITGDDVEEPKPHPEGVLKALSLLDLNKNEAMFIGDSDADIEAGLRANMLTFGVQWLPDYQTLDFKMEPNRIFSSVSEFTAYLKDVKI